MTVAWGYALRDLAGRHDFDDDVTQAVAALTADRCSNPHCRALTSGPMNDRTKSLNVGVTLAISAVAAGGPRHDATLSDTERHAESNAIWLCYTCARQVNSNAAGYPASVLRRWKTLPS
jgi:hypothetical protein